MGISEARARRFLAGLERSLAMVLGVLATSRRAVPICRWSAYPAARLRQIIDDAAPRLLLSDATGRAALGAEALADVSVVDPNMATAWPSGRRRTRSRARLTSRHLG
ncbi:hypothetical protein NKH45_31400 [Mesorhizobium sp. M1156]|uniref:hypothetical protein n=1 Tax=Mesorhizobium sp. M1156 TaxID=2957064 RepID=UPI00333A61B8